MKVFIRILSVILAVLMLTVAFASCGKRVKKGEYIRGSKVLDGYYEGFTFDGKEFSFDVYRAYQRDDALCYSGTYEIEIDKENSDKENDITVGTITLTYTNAEGAEVVEELSYYHEETEDGIVIKIDGIFYNYFEE